MTSTDQPALVGVADSRGSHLRVVLGGGCDWPCRCHPLASRHRMLVWFRFSCLALGNQKRQEQRRQLGLLTSAMVVRSKPGCAQNEALWRLGPHCYEPHGHCLGGMPGEGLSGWQWRSLITRMQGRAPPSRGLEEGDGATTVDQLNNDVSAFTWRSCPLHLLVKAPLSLLVNNMFLLPAVRQQEHSQAPSVHACWHNLNAWQHLCNNGRGHWYAVCVVASCGLCSLTPKGPPYRHRRGWLLLSEERQLWGCQWRGLAGLSL